MPNHGENLNPKILSKLRMNTDKTTLFYDIAGPFKNMRNLDDPVAIQLKQLDFYGGQLARQNDYVPENIYDDIIRGNTAKSVILEDVLDDFKDGQITFVGPAGCGKTTLLKTIARGVSSGIYQSLKDIKVVHYANVGRFHADKVLTVGEYLFRDNAEKLAEDEQESVIQFAVGNPGKVLFIIDSLDTLRYSPATSNTAMKINEKKDPATIMSNLLSGSLLPKCRFITSSREYAIKDFKDELRPSKVIGMAWLSTKSMHTLITGYLDESDAKEMIDILENQPILKAMCETPLFLVLTLIVRKRATSFKAHSVAGILVPVLQLLIRTEHVNRNDAIDVLEKLQNLSAKLTEELKVLFTVEDLAEFGLALDDVVALSVLSPKGTHQKLILGEEVLFFAHQSFQELLTAFHIIKRSQEDFEDLLQMRIHNPNYSVIRRMLCGTLMNSEVFEEAKEFFENVEEEDMKAKRMLLRWSIIEELATTNEADMETALLLAESGDGFQDMPLSSIRGITAGYGTLSAGRGHALALLFRMLKSVDKLDFSSCNLQTTGLEKFYQGLCEHKMQIGRLVLHRIEKVGVANLAIVGKLLSSHVVQKLEMKDEITYSEIASLAANTDENITVELSNPRLRVKIFPEDEIMPEKMMALCRFLKIFKTSRSPMTLNVENLAGAGWEADVTLASDIGNSGRGEFELVVRLGDNEAESTKSFHSFLKNIHLLKASIKLEVQVKTSRELSVIGNFLKQYHIKHAILSTTSLYQPTAQDWENFENELEGFQIQVLKLCRFFELGREKLSVIGRILRTNSEMKEIDLRQSEVTTGGLEAFKNQLASANVETFKLSIGRHQSCRTYLVAAQMIVQCCAKQLELCLYEKSNTAFSSLNECLKTTVEWEELDSSVAKILEIQQQNPSMTFLSPANFAALLEGFRGTQVVNLNISNVHFTARSIFKIVEMIPVWHVKMLYLKDCRMTAMDSRPIAASLTGPTLQTLTVSDRFGMLSVESLLPMFPRVSEEIDLTDKHLRDEDFQVLQTQINKVGAANLKIRAKLNGYERIMNRIQQDEPSMKTTAEKVDTESCHHPITIPITCENSPIVSIVTESTTVEDSRVSELAESIASDDSRDDELRTETMDESTTTNNFSDDKLEEKIRQNLTRPMCTAKVVGKEGGAMKVRGSKLKFLENSFDEEATVSLTVRMQDDDIPEDYVPVSPAIKCSTSNVQFKGLATVTLPIHYKVENENIMILSKKEIASEWKEVETTPLMENDSVIFQVGHFCWLQAFLPRKLYRMLGGKISLLNYIYFNRTTAAVRVLTCVKDKGVEEECTSGFASKGFEKALCNPDSIALGQKESMLYSIQCRSPTESKIVPEVEKSYSGEEFEFNKWEIARFCLEPTPKTSIVNLSYTLKRPNKKDPVISFLPLQWAIDEIPATKNMEDITSPITDLMVPGSTESDYLKHLQNDEVYHIEKDRPKGKVLIINNEFKQDTEKIRKGSKVDVNNLKALWKALGFTTISKNNLTAEEIRISCEEFADVECKNISVVVVIIMSHGGVKKGGTEFFTGEDKEPIFRKEVIDIFSSKNSKHLRGIPKVFMFQACRGKKKDIESDDDADSESDDDGNRHPEWSDMLFAFPTQPGYKALRNASTGSWLMNAVTKVFMERAHDTHVLDMLTTVNGKVSAKVAQKAGETRIQTSGQENYLRKKLFLFPGWPE